MGGRNPLDRGTLEARLAVRWSVAGVDGRSEGPSASEQDWSNDVTVTRPPAMRTLEPGDAQLLERYRASGSRDTRNLLVDRFGWLAERCARRYWDRGEPFDDLVQVASLGLIKAVERYDPARGPFVAFATPTILGELKRHFRDTTWSVSVPRRPKELRHRVSAATEALRHALGRSPTVDEIADAAALPKEHVLEALDADRVYRPLSLDLPTGNSMTDGKAGGEDRETTLLARELIARLDETDRDIVYLTYFEGWTQREIGSRLGLGQVQVSRRHRAALELLRALAASARTEAA